MPAVFILTVDSLIKKRFRHVQPNGYSRPSFIALYRLNKAAFQMILDVIAHDIGTTSIPQRAQLAAGLRFLAVGSFQGVLSNDMYLAMGRSAFCKILWKVIKAIENKIYPEWINIEMSPQHTNLSKLHFYEKYGIPGVVGCVDVTHVAINKPNCDSTLYYNRKGYYSVNAMINCDYTMCVHAVDSRNPGSSHDAFVWKMGDARVHYVEKQQNGTRNSWLLGDSGYGLEPFLITPYKDPEYGSIQQRFNKKHCLARNIVERSIGNLKNRFRCLQMVLPYQPENIVKIISACCALHNICKKYNIIFDEEVTPAEEYNEEAEEMYNTEEGRTVRDNIARSLM